MSHLDELPLTPATRALLDVVRRRMEGAGAADAASRAGGVDPAEMARLATRHGLEGLVAGSGVSGGDGGALTAVAGNLERIRELHRVVGVLAAADVPAVALKGPALAVQAWGDVSARSYGDVDVLVPAARAEATIAALAAAGYVDRRVRFGRTPSPLHWHDWSFTAPDGRTLVEIHWELVSPRRHPAVAVTEVWEEGALEEVAVPGGRVRALRAELQLPYLALHASAHHWGWLEFPLTLGALAARAGTSLDWDALASRARRWRARRATAVGLILAAELAGPGVEGVLPAHGARALGAGAGERRLARWYRDRLLLDPDGEWYRGSPALWWRAMALRDTLGERLSAGGRFLFAPTTAEWEPPGTPSGGTPAPLRRLLRLFRRWRGNS